jgi:hypothetical protein
MLASRGRRTGVATGCPVVVIMAATIAFGCGGAANTSDPYTAAANRLCRTAQDRLALATRQHRTAFHHGDPGPLARSMFTAIGTLQSKLDSLEPPNDELARAVELHGAVLEWERPIVDLIHISTSERKRVRGDAQQLESIEATVANRAAALGLNECAHLRVMIPRLP